MAEQSFMKSLFHGVIAEELLSPWPHPEGTERDATERLVSGIQRQVETLGEAEVSAKQIGEMVMDGLRQLDSVAYIRFASVYRDFSEAKDFEDFASAVQDAAKH